MKSLPKASFTEFIDFFPVLELPFSLLPDISQIPSHSMPLPEVLLETYILPFEGEEVDEYTEYIPFGRLASTKGFHALIYWKAGVMQYEYILATYTTEGDLLSHAIIGGLRSDEEGLLHSVAVIHEDMSLTIAEGIAIQDQPLNAEEAITYQMTIQPTGQIIYGAHEEENE